MAEREAIKSRRLCIDIYGYFLRFVQKYHGLYHADKIYPVLMRDWDLNLLHSKPALICLILHGIAPIEIVELIGHGEVGT